MDNGHYHPTEFVSDKISSILAYDEKMALHITRGVRWDSDHVVLFDDETREICKEIVRCDALDRVFIALDYFDASINRISAWVTGFRNLQKSLPLIAGTDSSCRIDWNKTAAGCHYRVVNVFFSCFLIPQSYFRKTDDFKINK